MGVLLGLNMQDYRRSIVYGVVILALLLLDGPKQERAGRKMCDCLAAPPAHNLKAIGSNPVLATIRSP